jgi:putative ABC transport system permease protein
LVTQTINDLYFSVSVRGVELEGATILKGVMLGLVAAVLAAVLPAAKRSVEPITALQRGDLENRVRRSAAEARPAPNCPGGALR